MDINSVPTLDELRKMTKEQVDEIIEPEDKVVPLSEAAALQPQITTAFPTGNKVMDDYLEGGFRGGDLIVIAGRSGEGKCHGKGTKILMFDGSIKNVEDVVVGDLLMGDDSKPRTVLSLARGKDSMYQLKPNKGGDVFTGNKEHILVLEKNKNISHRKTVNGKRVRMSTEIIKNVQTEISIKEYLTQSGKFKAVNKLVRIGVEFLEKPIPVEPYFLGMWLGDGTSESSCITTADKEVVDYLYKYAKRLNLKVTEQILNGGKNKSKNYSIVRSKKKNKEGSRYKHCYQGDALRTMLLNLGVLNNKHIPSIYKINSRKNRLLLLAGLIDSDGYINHNCLVFSNKNKQLCNDVIYLCRSLGYSAELKESYNKLYKTTYYKVSIWGSLEEIPSLLKRKKCLKRKQIKNHLRTGFEIKPLGEGQYYGFTLDGNHRYLLGDFTITHNTTFAQTITYFLTKMTIPVLWFSYEVSVVRLHEKFIGMGIEQHYEVYAPKRNKSGSIDWIEKKIIEGVKNNMTQVVFIDHIDFLSNREAKSSDNESQILKKITTELKQLAITLNVCIVLMAHVRKTQTRRELDMQDISSSSGIFQLADYVIMIERKLASKSNYVGGLSSGPSEIYTNDSEIKLVKNRLNGRTFRTPLRYMNNLLV